MKQMPLLQLEGRIANSSDRQALKELHNNRWLNYRDCKRKYHLAEYIETRKTIESFYGSTQEDIIRELGAPELIEKRGRSTYFIYQSEAYEYGVGVIILPIIPYRDTDVFCLFLEFDEASNLVKHAWADPSGDHPRGCIDEFYRPKPDTSPFCRNANSGHANAQKYIGDLYYFSYYNFFEKNLVSAYVWYSLAANNGHKGAAEQVDILTRELSPEQLSKAQIRLEEWKPDHGLSNWRCP